MVFKDVKLVERVVLQPSELTTNFRAIIQERLAKRLEGVCSHHGLVRRGSIRTVACQGGRVRSFSLNGDVEFAVTFDAQVANPARGDVVEARVTSTNKLGVLATVLDPESLDPVLEIVLVRNGIRGTKPDPTLESVVVGQSMLVEIVGRRYQLNDTKISAVGMIAAAPPPARVRPTTPLAAAAEELEEGGSPEFSSVEGEEDDDVSISLESANDSEPVDSDALSAKGYDDEGVDEDEASLDEDEDGGGASDDDDDVDSFSGF